MKRIFTILIALMPVAATFAFAGCRDNRRLDGTYTLRTVVSTMDISNRDVVDFLVERYPFAITIKGNQFTRNGAFSFTRHMDGLEVMMSITQPSTYSFELYLPEEFGERSASRRFKLEGETSMFSIIGNRTSIMQEFVFDDGHRLQFHFYR
ncbi:MAG: hypothetical protein FWC80_05760 [Firmicutes bacterium]|nr:hypothetical protein [Bacillota bacterium]